MSGLETRASLLVDAHAHFYDVFSVSDALDAASDNFVRAQAAAWKLGGTDPSAPTAGPPAGLLCLVEPPAGNRFDAWAEAAEAAPVTLSRSPGSWRARRTKEEASLALEREDGAHLYVIAGRQLQTAERLEVLSIGLRDVSADRAPLAEVVESIQARDGIPVVPWGAGKWIGARGGILNAFLRGPGRGLVCLGDSGGRPGSWRRPRHLAEAAAAGIPILPGSDPLPFRREATRLGSFGFAVRVDEFDPMAPAEALRRAVREGRALVPYGRSVGTWRFILNQARLRVRSPRRADAPVR
jgi:hypothetical protein